MEMFNLIKMNLYRMSHAVSTKVLAIVAVAISILGFGLMKIILDDPFHIFCDIEGLTLAGSASLSSSVTQLLASGMLIVISIFVVIFSNAEAKCGFNKNIIGITKSKWKHAVARWISAMIGVVIISGIAFIVYVGLQALFLNSFEVDSVSMFFRNLGLTYLCITAYSAVFFFFTTLFKSSAGGIVTAMIMVTGVLTLVATLIDLGFTKIFTNAAHVPSEFILSSVVPSFAADMAGTNVLKLVVITVCYIVVSMGASMFLEQRRDVA